MIVLTVNSGSTSVKLAAYDTAGATPKRLENEHHTGGSLEPHTLLRGILRKLPAPPDVVAHRVVHGGTRFTRPTRLDDQVIAAIEQLSELAPLHNPTALEWIRAARQECSDRTISEGIPSGEIPSGDHKVVQLAVFDTAFFADLPRTAAEYALPARMGVDHGVRRYGFHGLAHEAMWRRWCELYPRLPRGGRIITIQLGGGCSIAALDQGRPIDHSMGFSPLEGLVMATRSGDVDPSILPYLGKRLSLSPEELVGLLNHEAGLKGLSGKSANPGELLADTAPQSQFAVELYCYRLRKYIGAYCAVLHGCDGIVFGGGVGEHVPQVRERALSGMAWAGIELDAEANSAARGAEVAVQSTRSVVKIQVIPVDEELVMVRGAMEAGKA
jgi:acetate kinase